MLRLREQQNPQNCDHPIFAVLGQLIFFQTPTVSLFLLSFLGHQHF